MAFSCDGKRLLLYMMELCAVDRNVRIYSPECVEGVFSEVPVR
jgi:hypothetical protein